MHDGKVQAEIAVHEDVAKIGHLGKSLRVVLRDHIRPGQQLKKRPVRLRFAQALVGGDVGGHVEGDWMAI